jgi:hypothetical protein
MTTLRTWKTRWSQLESQAWQDNLQWLLKAIPGGLDIVRKLDEKFPGIWTSLEVPANHSAILLELGKTPEGVIILYSLNERLQEVPCFGATEASIVEDITTAFEDQAWTKLTDVPLTFVHSRDIRSRPPKRVIGTTEDVIRLQALPSSSCAGFSVSLAESQLEIITPPNVVEGTEPPTAPIAETRRVLDLDAIDSPQDRILVRVLHPFFRNYAGVNIARLSWSGAFSFLFTSGIAVIVEEAMFGILRRRLPGPIREKATRFLRAVARKLRI